MRYDWKAVAVAAAAVCATFAAACTKTETSITAPSDAADRCALTVTSSPNSFPSPGGKGSLTISTARDCTWSVASNAAWVALGGASGQGDATVPYTVSANPVPSPRSTAIAVGAQSVAVSQQAAPCIFSLSRANDTIGEAGGKLSVGVTTLSGCRWTAASTAAWISIASGQSGDGNGTVGLTVAANAGAARVGQVNIAGQIYTVSEAAAAPAPTPTPPTPGSPPPGPPPAPTPTPGPTPTPRHVDFSGTISSVFGRCPSVVFTAGGRAIFVDESTDFRRSKCGDLKEDRDVDGEGDVQANGVIKATTVHVGK
jgi:Viral BACON domain/Putative binding domain, N-terminal